METSFDDETIEAHTSHLMARARRLTRNEADARDLVQDTFLNALEALRSRDVRLDNPRGWLVAVMQNRWFNVLRHGKVRTNARAELASAESCDSMLCDARIMCGQLERAWERLSTQAQGIARQVLIDGDSEEQVSQRFGMTRGGVASSIHRTRQQLRLEMFGT